VLRIHFQCLTNTFSFSAKIKSFHSNTLILKIFHLEKTTSTNTWRRNRSSTIRKSTIIRKFKWTFN